MASPITIPCTLRFRGRSLRSYGDASALSFHATKLFSTGEGGALVMRSKAQKDTVWSLKNYCIVSEESLAISGINGKMNEFQAAFGLLQLQQVDTEIARRLEIDRRYREILSGARGVLSFPVSPETEPNGSYFPVLIDETASALSRDEFYSALKKCNVHPRKYFYPLCSHLKLSLLGGSAIGTTGESAKSGTNHSSNTLSTDLRIVGT